MKFRTKLLFVMKLTTALILFAAMHVYAKTSGQVVSYSARNAKLEQVFRALEQQTGYGFFYQVSDLKNAQPVSVDFKNLALPDALRMILKDQTLNFFIDGKTVFITPKKKEVDLAQGLNSGLQSPPKLIDVRGKVVDEEGKAIAGASVVVKGSTRGVSTNENGEFELNGVDGNATLVISGVNIERFEVKVNGRGQLGVLKTTAKISELADVTISAVNTGYQQIPKERATGSFVFIDSALINRSVGTNIIDRLNGITNGVAFNNNIVGGNIIVQKNQSQLSVRGRGTINSNPNALIILDNFPYDGDLNTINPDDIESITVLKDAAASAIWGSYSGNGVIVLTSRKGKYNQPMNISVNSFISIGDKPDLNYTPILNSSEYIDVELFLYKNGFYNSVLSGNNRSQVTPLVEMLAKRAAGQIGSTDSANFINSIRNNDFRKDLSKDFYQKPLSQHYDIGLSGGGQNNRYFFSLGYDNNKLVKTANSFERFNLRFRNSFSMIPKKLEINTDIQFAKNNSINNGSSLTLNVPYYSLVDANGNAAALPNGYRMSYLDTVGQGKLLDWFYRPLDELSYSNNSSSLTDYHINTSVTYHIIKGLDVNTFYNYNTGTSNREFLQDQNSYYTRNQINSYSQINFTTGIVTRPVPLGGIVDRTLANYKSSNFRTNLSYLNKWKSHDINVQVGYEERQISSTNSSYRLYGYNPSNQTSINVDYVGFYPGYVTRNNTQIPSNVSNLVTKNNFISYYGLVGYSYLNKYSFTASIRKDQSNIYGVTTNMKGVPLYSAGLSWKISNEKFYQFGLLPYLRLRATFGYNGNSNTEVAAVTTIRYGTTNSYGGIQAAISNIPNPSLRWEKVQQLNYGIDFGSKNNVIEGSLEYYVKNAKDLIAASPIDPTTGNASITNNSASLTTKGVDIQITSHNINKRYLRWTSSFIFNFVLDKITAYYGQTSSINTYVQNGFINPIIGRPLYSMYVYPYGGLDSVGNPKAILDGKTSYAYNTLFSSRNFDNIRYIGPMNPPINGSLRNDFHYKQVTLSLLIRYSFGGYFRRFSANYSSMFSATGGGSAWSLPDYGQRWQKQGDENLTNVPAMIYSGYNNGRDNFYANSDVLVEKSDFIKLQDVRVSYDLSPSILKRSPFKNLQFFVFLNNIGFLWKANKCGIDPENVPFTFTASNPKLFSFGLKANL